MADFLTPAERSVLMSKIRSTDTSPELALRKALHALGFRYRLHNKSLPGKPDLTLARHNTVIFVHGCFWHRHANCKVASIPKSNTAFWLEKFDKNVTRDALNQGKLEETGWQVLTVWECELSSGKRARETSMRLAEKIRGSAGERKDFRPGRKTGSAQVSGRGKPRPNAR